MKFQSELMVYGMKASKGALENGTPYDSTKLYTLVDMDGSKGNASGQAAAEYAFGDSTEYEKFKHLPFPFRAVVELEMVTNGKVAKTVVTAVRPITDQKAASKVS